jgi:esterase/lipase superfamily enzyme
MGTRVRPRELNGVMLLSLVLAAGCATAPVDRVELMPAPQVFDDGRLNPLPQDPPYERLPYDGILYATDRAPAAADDRQEYYLNDRGEVLRVGLAEIEYGAGRFTWDLAREISLLSNRSESFPVEITRAEEWGYLGATMPPWVKPSTLDIEAEQLVEEATSRFTQAINEQLEQSRKKNVYIYVHGYEVVFENPVLLSAQLWHFLGYDGVFVAYSWPSTPKSVAYIRDSDTSAGYARNLRLLIETIAQDTDVERINILGWSNGTRLVTRTLEQLALIHQGRTRKQIFEAVKIDNVVLVGSDLDRGVFGAYVSDGLLNVPRHMTVYMSDHDKALGFSQFLTKRQRLGQLWGGSGGAITPPVREAVMGFRDRLSFINVSAAEGAGGDNGHGYFKSSPWASSDILMTFFFALPPLERGLVEQQDLPVFTFPEDYPDRLRTILKQVSPAYAAALAEASAAAP